jgi:hypothetical protein
MTGFFAGRLWLSAAALVGLTAGFFASERPVGAGMKPFTCTQKLCGGKCVAPAPQNGCGAAGCNQCGVVGAAAVCEAAGPTTSCGYTTCFSGRQDRDGRRNNGCEAIVTNHFKFPISAKFRVESIEGATVYRFILAPPGGRMTQSGNTINTPASFSLRTPRSETAAAIERCLAMSVAIATPGKVWLEIFTHSEGPDAIVQVPYLDNTPPDYNNVILSLPASPKLSVTCHVNLEPIG